MIYLLENFWIWSLVSLVCGGIISYLWVPQPSRRIFARWAAIVLLCGLVMAVLRVFPGRPGLYLETLLLVLLSYVVGWLFGGWLARSTETALASDARLGARAVRLRSSGTAAVVGGRSTAQQDEDDSVHISTVSMLAEELRQAAAARASAEARRAAEAKAAEEAHQAAVLKATEEARHAAELKAAEELCQAAAAKASEEARRAAEAKAAQEARQAAVVKATEEARHAAELEAAEELRQVAAAKAAEGARRAAETKATEEARQIADAPHNGHVESVDPGAKPAGIAVPWGGRSDDLTCIKGIGPKNQRVCNNLGVHHFSQIADWTANEARWIGHQIAFPGRIEREHWIDQAKLLAAGGDTEHSVAVKTGAILVDDKADAPLDDAEVAALRASLPTPAAAVEGEMEHEGRRPYGLSSPHHGRADDLQRIRGIGPQNESRLHALGIWYFAQIAAWSPENVLWVGSYLAFPGRIDREKWIAQANDLAAGRDNEVRRHTSGSGGVGPNWVSDKELQSTPFR
jgi:predicted flap endonuclease-1-like 5' DNA nuclease